MHSKWQIWDFFYSFDKTFLSKFQGVLLLNTFDVTSLKLVKDFLFKTKAEREIKHKVASEISKNWLDDEFNSMSLFVNEDCFFIHQAQELSSDIIEFISSLRLENRFIILSFENQGPHWKKIIKDPNFKILELEGPKHWENSKLLDFVASYFRLPLSFEAKSWIIDYTDNSLSSFYHSASVLKINYPTSNDIGILQVKELILSDKLDQFALASIFCKKRFVDFYHRLLLQAGDFDKMRDLFRFMQSHLIKLSDLSYLSEKTRLTSYDKDLQSCEKLWKKQELSDEISAFSRWEIMCKQKNNLLWHELKAKALCVEF
jgi:hypothetical protein